MYVAVHYPLMSYMCKVKWLWVMGLWHGIVSGHWFFVPPCEGQKVLCAFTLITSQWLCPCASFMALIGDLLSSLRHPHLEETCETRSPLCILCCCVINGGAVIRLFLCTASLIRLHLYKDSSTDVDVLQQCPSFSWFGCLSLRAHLSLSCADFTHL